jgi:hypothetical protein
MADNEHCSCFAFGNFQLPLSEERPSNLTENFREQKRSTEIKLVPVPLQPPKIPHKNTGMETGPSRRQLAMARPKVRLTQKSDLFKILDFKLKSVEPEHRVQYHYTQICNLPRTISVK